MRNLNINPSKTTTHCAPDRWNPRGWSLGKKLTALAVIAVVGGGTFAAFRPDKLFVNDRVNESFPAQTIGAAAPALISEGNFTSQAHHTQGAASLYKTGASYTLRLMNFATSNGPDVHLYLTQGEGTDNASIKAGHFLDLGNLKGNIGDQNYVLPANFNPAHYHGVSVWCKRFAVGFAGTDLAVASGAIPVNAPASPTAKIVPVAMNGTVNGAMNVEKPVTVTTGQFHQIAHATNGTATITEDSHGARTLTLNSFKTGAGPALHLYLWKAENVKDNAAAKKLVAGKSYLDLGALKATSGTQTYRVPKEIDLWQYLAVGVWCDKFDVNFGTAPLSSPQ